MSGALPTTTARVRSGVRDVPSSVVPVSRVFGFDRGRCIDRHYIEGFLEEHAADIRGRVLEFADAAYTRRFGRSRVTRSEVISLDINCNRPTIVTDLTRGSAVRAATFDCIICTQVLPFVFDVPAVVRSLRAMLKPGGTVLATVPGISRISNYDMDRWGDYWRFTTLSMRRLFQESFGEEDVDVRSYGNVAAATAFLYGRAEHELQPDELSYHDPDYQLIITARATAARQTTCGRSRSSNESP